MWREQGLRDRTSLFDERSAGALKGQGVRDRTSLFDVGVGRDVERTGTEGQDFSL